jgi:hypothetical protein
MYSKTTQETGENLANKLSIPCGIDIPQKKYYILTWGARLPKKKLHHSTIERLNNRSLWSNPVKQIELNANKQKSLFYLYGQKLPTPYVSMPNYVFRAICRGKLHYPIIGRTEQHVSGSGFYMCLQKRDIQLCRQKVGYFMQHIPIKNEYRVHIFYGKPIRVSKKVAKTSADKWIRTNSKGWSFKDIYPRQIKDTLLQASIDAVRCLGLHYGAVDIIEGEDNKPYILEVNTAPSLNKKGLRLYTEAFKQIIQGLTI